MKVVDRSAIVPYSARQMFNLVKDVERYPDFLPWCSGARILAEMENGVKAEVDIRKGKLNKSFSTVNTYNDHKSISMNLLDGPFSHLQGNWVFDNLSEHGSRVSLHLEFDFSSTVARVTIGTVFNSIADHLVDAFVKRAEEIYE